MLEKAIITSCSTKFFPSVINLISSIKVVYPDHPTIFVYDLGLLPIFRKELAMVEGVEVVDMPKFCAHWRSCYTWKTYIFAHPMAKLNFYLDAGCQVLKSLDKVFDIIEEKDILLIDQRLSFKEIVPESYKKLFSLSDDCDDLLTIHAGIIGFKNTTNIINIFNDIYNAACVGLTLGFSSRDKKRNKSKDKNIFVRDCDLFRHDMTLVNVFFRKYHDDIRLHSIDLFHFDKNVVPEQFVWQLRLLYTKLDNLNIKILHKNTKVLFILNRFLIYFFIKIKNLNIFIKKKIFTIK